MYHVPMCKWCGHAEVASRSGGNVDYCSTECQSAAELDLAENDPAEVAEREARWAEMAADIRAEAAGGFYGDARVFFEPLQQWAPGEDGQGGWLKH